MSRTLSRDVVLAAAAEAGIATNDIHLRYHHVDGLPGWGVVLRRNHLPLFGACLLRAIVLDAEIGTDAEPDILQATQDAVLMLTSAHVHGARKEVVVVFPDWRLVEA
jgi:hypothetical protein